MNRYGKRLLIVSNRLPVVIEENNNTWRIQSGTGGLVTALNPVMEENRGIWIGWPGAPKSECVEKLLEKFNSDIPYDLKPVWLAQDEIDQYYHGFSNESIWPLFHDLLGHCQFEQDSWKSYVQVNRHFARNIIENLQSDDFLWVHDYQLMLVAQSLRRLRITQPVAFFLHIPFPSLDLFRRLPWKYQIIQALMEYDLLGFQTLRDRRNFVQCVKAFIPQVEISIKKGYSLLQYGVRTIKVGHFPISIDFNEFNQGAKAKDVADAAWYLHENLRGRQLILGLDRLDYTKGVPERFRALECALDKYPELRGNISLIQVIIPSRTRVQDYIELKERLDGLTGRINGKFSEHGWVPIHYIYRTLERVQLLGHYRACEIALITPLRDGMNLVAKEYCASSVDNNGVLILSEFAGAADQLARGALVVNPYDIEGTADAIYRAYRMGKEERKRRMRFMRNKIKQNNVHHWVQWFLGAFTPGVASDLGSQAPINDGENREMTNMRLWMDQIEQNNP